MTTTMRDPNYETPNEMRRRAGVLRTKATTLVTLGYMTLARDCNDEADNLSRLADEAEAAK